VPHRSAALSDAIAVAHAGGVIDAGVVTDAGNVVTAAARRGDAITIAVSVTVTMR